MSGVDGTTVDRPCFRCSVTLEDFCIIKCAVAQNMTGPLRARKE